MAADTQNTLTKVDSLTEESKAPEAKKGTRRASSMAADVYNITDLGEPCCQLFNFAPECGADRDHREGRN